MDRIDTLVAKIAAIERFNHGAMKLANEDVTLTGLFSNLLRYLLDEWVEGPPITKADALPLAKVAIRAMSLGLRNPTRESLTDRLNGPERPVVPLLAVRWVMRNANIRVVMPHLVMGSEWSEFVEHYQHVIAALDPDLFRFRDA